MNCTFTCKTLIDPKSFYNSISNLYISREYGSRYPAIKDLGIGVTNAVPPSYLEKDIANFVIVDKPEYDLIEKQEREKRQYHCKKNLWELSLSLHMFYELLFPDFTTMDSDGEIIITKFFKHYKVMRNLNLSEYYDSKYTETESECSGSKDESEDEYVYSNNMPLHL
ncbi:hypothetical protein C1645_817842 [Glomus cerebriforme]|uniref:Uncharacterized protein n=1 Tax=Glomus cerebriforme TaxID=658196 RepID=A0A397TDN3_9GLOM|nr:hypothetical protein C1645_817842 [Glomus cerebriforme]